MPSKRSDTLTTLAIIAATAAFAAVIVARVRRTDIGPPGHGYVSSPGKFKVGR